MCPTHKNPVAGSLCTNWQCELSSQPSHSSPAQDELRCRTAPSSIPAAAPISRNCRLNKNSVDFNSDVTTLNLIFARQCIQMYTRLQESNFYLFCRKLKWDSRQWKIHSLLSFHCFHFCEEQSSAVICRRYKGSCWRTMDQFLSRNITWIYAVPVRFATRLILHNIYLPGEVFQRIIQLQ